MNKILIYATSHISGTVNQSKRFTVFYATSHKKEQGEK